jgi:predicted nucleic acid-binding protein
VHNVCDLDAGSVEAALAALASAPIARHPLATLLAGAWVVRDHLRLVDALYVELSGALAATLLTTDARLSRACRAAELLTAPAVDT